MVTRVSDNIIHNKMLESLGQARLRQVKTQEATSTMKAVNRPSDDPIATTHILRLRHAEGMNDQFSKNASLAMDYLNHTDGALQSAADILMRVQELAIQQSSDASATPQTRKSIGLEVSNLMGQMIQIANTRFGERHIFGGFNTLDTPFDAVGNYHGDRGSIPVEVKSNYYLAMNVPGELPFHGIGAPRGVNVFEVIDRLRFGLEMNDKGLMQSTLEDISDALQQMTSVRASIGARVRAIDSSQGMLSNEKTENAKLKSEFEDADLFKAVTDLSRDEDVLHRTLATSSRLVQGNLFDFLK